MGRYSTDVNGSVIVSTLVIFAVGLAGCEKKSDDIPDITRRTGVGRSAPNDSDGLPRPLASIELRRYLDAFAKEWDRITSEANGGDTTAKRREIALAAVTKLGGCPELIQLLDFLSANGAGDLREDLIDNHLGVIFAGPNAVEAREWVLTLGNEKLRERLCLSAGKAFAGVGFKEYFERTGEKAGHHCQAALLAGYCVTLAKTDPEAAVRVYKEMGYPHKIDNTGMALVVAAFPPTADFLKFATETRDDSMTLAKRTRAALLANWAGVKPAEAAQYVVANSKVVHPDQMGVVIGKWAEADSDAATEWLNQTPPGKARDEGMAALARHWTAGDPARAWQYAVSVGDAVQRGKVVKDVFKEWEKADPAAAAAAWKELYPGR